MKKIILILSLMFIVPLAFCAETNWDSEAALSRVNTIGQELLEKNSLPTEITFNVSEEDHVNAYATIDKEIYVYKGLLEYVSDDSELVGVISHEIGHIINAHCAKQSLFQTLLNFIKPNFQSERANTTVSIANELVSLKMSREAEYDADITGAELMMNAGYNPMAMISVLNKICEKSFDVTSTHPSGEKRLLNIYDYMTYVYPDVKKMSYNSDSYKNAYAYISQVVAQRENNEKKMQKYNKSMEKIKQRRIKAAKRAKENKNNPWDTSYLILNAVSSFTN